MARCGGVPTTSLMLRRPYAPYVERPTELSDVRCGDYPLGCFGAEWVRWSILLTVGSSPVMPFHGRLCWSASKSAFSCVKSRATTTLLAADSILRIGTTTCA